MTQTDNARRLRKNMTDAEKHLWRYLRHEQIEGCKFRRQNPIGPYIVDFISFDAMLIIELDGGQHAENIEADQQRTQFLNSRGFKVIRFWNNQVLQETEAVLEVIRREAKTPPPNGGRLGGGRSNDGEAPNLTRPHPNPPPGGEGTLELNSTALNPAEITPRKLRNAQPLVIEGVSASQMILEERQGKEMDGGFSVGEVE